MSNIKMVVTDLDGTFLQSDESISNRTTSAFKRCRELGLKLAYATGRGATSTMIVPSELFDGFVRCNGASAHDGDTLIHSSLIDIDTVRPLLLAFVENGFEIVAECGGVHCSTFNVTERWKWLIESKIVDFNTFNGKAEKIYSPSACAEVQELLAIYTPSDYYSNSSNDGFSFVMHKDATKSKGVNALANRWGIKSDEIVAFGDDTNDIDLLEYCGIGVAMGNALDNIKAVANEICDTNNNDGIAKWLEENLL
ncbi:MAG: HAD family hydrolase [Oscillospiraceae bacterium]|nr:HAD family hydrolase [Oscillospiraceae bacterium]MCL2248317.1 HAD family hydrolase [Oscillospiraceae bacterium]